jgi:outer membrane murein-binding lipoprotein Lpp
MPLRSRLVRALALAALTTAGCASPQKEDAETRELHRRVAELEARLQALSSPTPAAVEPTPRPASRRTSATTVKRRARSAGSATASRSAQTGAVVLPDDDMTQMLLDDPALRDAPPIERQAPVSASEHWSVPDGAQIELILQTALSTCNSAVGDPVVARIQRLADADGPLPLPSESVIDGRVTRVKPAGRVSSRLSVVFDRITVRGHRQALDPIIATFEGHGSIERDGGLVAGGAAAGAIVGGLIGGKSGARRGAVIGAAGGAGAALATKAPDLELHVGDRWIVTVARLPRAQRE